jgi:hypothetical protein
MRQEKWEASPFLSRPQTSTITKRLDTIIWLLTVGLAIGVAALWRAGLLCSWVRAANGLGGWRCWRRRWLSRLQGGFGRQFLILVLTSLANRFATMKPTGYL